MIISPRTVDADRLVSLIEERYPGPGHYQLSEKVFLIRDEGITETVAENVGIGDIDEDEPGIGIVFKLNGARSGLERPAVWEWLDLDDES